MSVYAVGITGHINIAGQARATIAAEIASELARIDGPLEGFTSLAPGADQAFAWAVKSVGGSVVFVRPAIAIESTIPAANLADFRAAAALAARIVDIPYDEPSEEAYFEAGAYIADNVDLLLAVWDGNPSGGLGGTGDIVERRVKSGRPIKVIWPADAVRG